MLRLLGSVALEDGDGPISSGGPKERAVLAVLAVNRNGVVGIDTLTDILWGDEPPRTATKTLNIYVSRLRAGLAGTGATIEREPPGFVLRIGADQVDADVAAREAAAAIALLASDPHGCAAMLADVLELWRGPALAEFADEAFARPEAVRLAELRAGVEEDLLGAQLAAGEAPVADAERLVGEMPLRERRWALLMRALYRDDRQADALRAFQRARTTLGDELGLEPGPILRELEQAIVAHDPELRVGVTPPATALRPDAAPLDGATTFLLTDVEGSTKRWEHDAAAMTDLLVEHDRVALALVTGAGGQLVKSKGEGDSTFSVFAEPAHAVAAAIAMQQQLPLPVRMAIHHGEAEARDGDWFGPTVNRVARLRGVAHGRQVLLTSTAADLVRDCLPEHCSLRDLGTHRLKDIETTEQIWQLCAPDLQAEFPPVRTRSAELTNLPAELSSFVGRTSELAQVIALTSESRLVTLTGPGGSGKTRLAMQAGAQLLGGVTDGVWLVELAPVGAEQLGASVAAALRVEAPAGQDPIDAVVEATSELHLIVVLDNCEHLVADAAAVAERLLAACPNLRILATSRERLGVAGEALWPVLPLEVPDADDDPDAEAVRLFVERARAAAPSFELTEANLPAIATICRRLDGIPLAIELAAARTRLLEPAEIAHRLDDRFGLLTGGVRTAMPRQQTLRALVDWSYELLDDDERALFRALSVFRGGFTLAAAEAMHRIAGNAATDVFDLVDRLAQKSLIVAGDERRFRMLETLREYGLSQLGDDEAAALHFSHADWVERMMSANARFTGPSQLDAVNIARAEQDNVAAALTWCLDNHAGAVAASIVANSWRAWYITGFVRDGSLWANRVLDAADKDDLDSAIRAELLTGTAWLGHVSETRTDSGALLRESVVVAEEAGDDRRAAMAHALLGEVIRQREVDGDGLPNLHRAIELADGCGATQEGGIARMFLSFTTADRDANDALIREALAASEAAGDRWLIGLLAQLLGWTEADPDEGDRLRALAMDAARELGDNRNLAATLRQEAIVRVARGEHDAAREYALDALSLARASGDLSNRGTHVWECGLVLEAVGDRGPARALIEESMRNFPPAQVAMNLPAGHVLLAYLDRDEEDLAGALARLEQAYAIGIGGPNVYTLGIAVRLTATLAAEAGDRGVVAALLDGLDAATARGEWTALPEDLHHADDLRRIADRLGDLPERQPDTLPDGAATLELAHQWVKARSAAVSAPGGVGPVGVEA